MSLSSGYRITAGICPQGAPGKKLGRKNPISGLAKLVTSAVSITSVISATRKKTNQLFLKRN
jgi:hypothetical protein